MTKCNLTLYLKQCSGGSQRMVATTCQKTHSGAGVGGQCSALLREQVINRTGSLHGWLESGVNILEETVKKTEVTNSSRAVELIKAENTMCFTTPD